MARTRNLSPSFFLDEQLAALPIRTRYILLGMFPLADRAGRLEDRPLWVAAQVLPFEADKDIEADLQALAECGAILRYAVAGKRYIEIGRTFTGQHFHVKEAASTIPAPDKHGASTVQAPGEHGVSPVQAGLQLVSSTCSFSEVVAPAVAVAAAEGSPKPVSRKAKQPKTPKEPKPPSDHQRVVAAYSEAFTVAKGAKPGINAHDGKELRELLASGITAGEIISTLPVYLASSGYAAEQGWPLWCLCRDFNKLRLGATSQPRTERRQVAPPAYRKPDRPLRNDLAEFMPAPKDEVAS